MTNHDTELMSSSKPYLLRAFYEWIVDNHKTPYVVLNANYPGTRVPKQYVDNGRIVLNVSMTAVGAFVMDNVKLEFKASFGGVQHTILAPIAAVMAIYARENGKGMIFAEDEVDEGGWEATPEHELVTTKPNLIKGNDADNPNISSTSTDENPDNDDTNKGKSKKLPDFLRIIK